MNVFKMKKLALALGSLAVLGFASQAEAIGVFTVNPLAPGVSIFAPGTREAAFQADFVTGFSSELLHNSASQSTGSGYLQFGGFSLNGNAIGSSKSGIVDNYNLYLTFQLVANGPLGSTQTLQSLNFQLFIDPQANDVFNPATVSGNTGTDASITNMSGDQLIGFGSLLAGTAALNSGGVTLNSTNSFSLCSGVNTAKTGSTSVAGNTTVGSTTYTCSAAPTGQTGTTPDLGFFTSPQPFYQLVFSNFNNTADGVTRSTDGSLAAIRQANGGVSFIPVPEPGTIALFGIAAVAMGVSSRRRNRK